MDLNIDLHGGFYGIITLSYRGIYHLYHLNVIPMYMPTVYSWPHEIQNLLIAAFNQVLVKVAEDEDPLSLKAAKEILRPFPD